MIEAGMRRVVVAIQDSDPRVNGGGLRRFRDAAIALSCRSTSARARRRRG
jgi:diaminohydroxyphosphoribosylaminopyrimidine deaminase/5-amino-6-(5-phosphoribosylamino)uracil reductase